VTLTPTRRLAAADRRAQITEAAAVAFGHRGYHAVGMADIAAAVGISGPALYRHFPNKYALFAHTALREMQALVEAGRAAASPASAGGADDELERVVRAISRTTIAHRAHGSLYRWEARFLEPADREVLRHETKALRSLVATPLLAVRPELGERDATLLAAGALAVLASVSSHRITLTGDALTELLVGAARRVLAADLPRGPVGPPSPPWHPGLRPSSKGERLVTEALKAFEQQGYHQATLEEIGRAVGLNASSVYRYFPTKAALLSAGFQRAAHQLSAVTEAALAEATDARTALGALAAAYVRLWFLRPEVMTVYFAEAAHVPEADREELRQAQRDHVEEWVHLVRELEPGLNAIESRVRVHAALNVAVDIGRLVRFDRRPEARARVETLMVAVLLDPTPVTAGPSLPRPTEETDR
jgi:AcrR family transcriptional regulator